MSGSNRARSTRLPVAAGVCLTVLIASVTLSTPQAVAAPLAAPKPYLGLIVKGHGVRPTTPKGRALASVSPARSTTLTAQRVIASLPKTVHGSGEQTHPEGPGSVPVASVAGGWQAVGSSTLAVAAAQPVASGR